MKLDGSFSAQLRVPGSIRRSVEDVYVTSGSENQACILSRAAAERLGLVAFSKEVKMSVLPVKVKQQPASAASCVVPVAKGEESYVSRVKTFDPSIKSWSVSSNLVVSSVRESQHSKAAEAGKLIKFQFSPNPARQARGAKFVSMSFQPGGFFMQPVTTSRQRRNNILKEKESRLNLGSVSFLGPEVIRPIPFLSIAAVQR